MGAPLCRLCHKRPAKFRVKGGKVKADRTHDVCFQCARALKNRERCRRQG